MAVVPVRVQFVEGAGVAEVVEVGVAEVVDVEVGVAEVVVGVVVVVVEVEVVEVLVHVAGHVLGTSSTSPGVNVADITPLPAGWSKSPRTWPTSWRTTVSRSMCAEAVALEKSALHPQPAAFVLTSIEAPFVMPRSRPGSVATLAVTSPKSGSSVAGAIACHSATACFVAVASCVAVTASLSGTGVEGADAAWASIGLFGVAGVVVVDVDVVVELEPVAVEAVVVDEGVVPPVGGVVEDADVPVVVVPVDVEPLVPDEPPVPAFDPVEPPTVTVWLVEVPLVVLVVVPVAVVVVVVELFVTVTGHETDFASMTTFGPKLQWLADVPFAVEGEEDDPGEVPDGVAGVTVTVVWTGTTL